MYSEKVFNAYFYEKFIYVAKRGTGQFFEKR